MKEIKTISIKCDCDKTIDFHELQSFQGGLKEHTESDYEKAKTSILQYGWSFVLYYWNDGKTKWIIDGHNRCEVLSRLEAEGYIIPPVPAIEVFCKNRKEAKQKLLRLNSTFGRLSKESVLEFAEDIELNFDEIALPDTTIDFSDGEEIAETEGDDEVPDINEKEKPNSERGCMYELGNSILMCGDSTNAEDVARLMGGEKADMIFTDPPYNVAIGDKNKALQSFQPSGRITENIENDFFKTDEECAEKLWLPCFKNLFENAKDECAIYVTMPQGGTHMMMMMMMMRDSGWQVKHELIWVKNSPTFSMGRLNYDYQHEPILYGWKKTHKWVGKGKFNKSIWEIDKPRKCDLHPTMKPIELIENALLNSSEKNDLILDLFGGSGSTLIACEKNKRRARLMEIDPRYVDVIRKRYTLFAKQNGLKLTSGCLE
jgi:DNA modification methylase